MSGTAPFLDPARLKLSVARLGADGHSLASSWHDFLGTASTDLEAVFNVFDSESLTGSGFVGRSLPGDISLEGKQLTVELDPRTALYFIGAALGTFDTASPVAGVFEYTFSQNRGTSFGKCLAKRWTMGTVARIIRPIFVRQSVFSFSGNNAHVQFALTLDAERVDEVGDPVLIAGAAPAGSAPFVQGLPLDFEINDPDPFLHLKVTDISGLPGLVKVAAKVGAAVYAHESEVTLGQPMILKHPDGRIMGAPGAELQVIFEDLTGLAVDDEWRLPIQRPVWIPVITTPIACSSAMAIGTVNGINFRPTQGSFTLNNPVQFNTSGGDRFRTGAIGNIGGEEGLWSYQRASIDDQVAQLVRNPLAEVSMAAQFRTAERIGTTPHYHQIDIISPVCNPASGITAQQLGSATSVTDTLVVRSQPSGDPTYPDANNIVVTTDIADPLL